MLFHHYVFLAALLLNSSSILCNSDWIAVLERAADKPCNILAWFPIDVFEEEATTDGADGYSIWFWVHDDAIVVPFAPFTPLFILLSILVVLLLLPLRAEYDFLVSSIRMLVFAWRFLAMCNCIAASSLKKK